MKVVITGGAGYIGSQLVYELAQDASITEILVYDNLSGGNYNLFTSHLNKIGVDKISFIAGDLLDSRKLGAALKGTDVVYHLAAKRSKPFSNVDSHFFEQVNHWGTAELVYAAEKAAVKRFVYLGSTAVYGPSKGEEQHNEDSHTSPDTFYGVSKLRGEEHVRRLMNDSAMEVVSLRCGNVYGYTPAVGFETVINKFMFDAHFKNRISIHGSGNQQRPFVPVAKVIKALVESINGTLPNGLYNLVDKNIKVLDIVDVMKELYPPLEFIFINQHLEMADIMVDSTSKLDAYVKWDSKSLKEELAFFKTHFAFSPQLP